jgi:hypothetical protein
LKFDAVSPTNTYITARHMKNGEPSETVIDERISYSSSELKPTKWGEHHQTTYIKKNVHQSTHLYLDRFGAFPTTKDMIISEKVEHFVKQRLNISTSASVD